MIIRHERRTDYPSGNLSDSLSNLIRPFLHMEIPRAIFDLIGRLTHKQRQREKDLTNVRPNLFYYQAMQRNKVPHWPHLHWTLFFLHKKASSLTGHSSCSKPLPKNLFKLFDSHSQRWRDAKKHDFNLTKNRLGESFLKKRRLVDLLESFETDSAVLGSDGNLQEVGVERQAPVEAESLAEDPFVVVLDRVDDGRPRLISGRIEVVQADRLLGPDGEHIGTRMNLEAAQNASGRSHGDISKKFWPGTNGWRILMVINKTIANICNPNWIFNSNHGAWF